MPNAPSHSGTSGYAVAIGQAGGFNARRKSGRRWGSAPGSVRSLAGLAGRRVHPAAAERQATVRAASSMRLNRHVFSNLLPLSSTSNSAAWGTVTWCRSCPLGEPLRASRTRRPELRSGPYLLRGIVGRARHEVTTTNHGSHRVVCSQPSERSLQRKRPRAKRSKKKKKREIRLGALASSAPFVDGNVAWWVDRRRCTPGARPIREPRGPEKLALPTPLAGEDSCSPAAGAQSPLCKRGRSTRERPASEHTFAGPTNPTLVAVTSSFRLGAITPHARQCFRAASDASATRLGSYYEVLPGPHGPASNQSDDRGSQLAPPPGSLLRRKKKESTCRRLALLRTGVVGPRRAYVFAVNGPSRFSCVPTSPSPTGFSKRQPPPWSEVLLTLSSKIPKKRFAVPGIARRAVSPRAVPGGGWPCRPASCAGLPVGRPHALLMGWSIPSRGAERSTWCRRPLVHCCGAGGQRVTVRTTRLANSPYSAFWARRSRGASAGTPIERRAFTASCLDQAWVLGVSISNDSSLSCALNLASSAGAPPPKAGAGRTRRGENRCPFGVS